MLIMPLPRIRRLLRLNKSTAEDLRAHAIRLISCDAQWRNETHPSRVIEIPTPTDGSVFDIHDTSLIPGGEWLLVLLANGILYAVSTAPSKEGVIGAVIQTLTNENSVGCPDKIRKFVTSFDVIRLAVLEIYQNRSNGYVNCDDCRMSLSIF